MPPRTLFPASSPDHRRAFSDIGATLRGPMSDAGGSIREGAPEPSPPTVRTGRAGSFEEPRSIDQARPRSRGWRQLSEPVVVRCFLITTWVDALAFDVNDDTREIRIEWPPPGSLASGLSNHHEVIDAWHYRLVPGLFP
jgi:hypothetical protein